jgi:hypothetical protein
MPGHDERRPRAGSGATSSNSSTADDTPAALFGAAVSVGAYGNRTTSYTLPDVASPHVRGPGPRPPTTGPSDAEAPQWWWSEAERIVLALVTAGRTVSSDDLHLRYPHEPSATGAAFGGLFSRLSQAGKIREVGMIRSVRPEARRRRIIQWGRP